MILYQQVIISVGNVNGTWRKVAKWENGAKLKYFMGQFWKKSNQNF